MSNIKRTYTNNEVRDMLRSGRHNYYTTALRQTAAECALPFNTVTPINIVVKALIDLGAAN